MLGKKDFGLSANILKIIGAVAMFIDHLGYMIFPDVLALRIIGRLAFPIFSFLIYEGCRYTRNKLKYFLQVFILGVLCCVTFYFTDNQVYLNVLVSFSFSIALIFLLNYFVAVTDAVIKFAGLTLFAVALVALYFLSQVVYIDYGFYGILLPLFPAVCDLIFKRDGKKTLVLTPQFYAFLAGLAFFVAVYVSELGDVKYYALLSLIPLAFYNGKRGFRLHKYFFYIFYPAHLGLIWAIAQII